jgi:hypothetical protein
MIAAILNLQRDRGLRKGVRMERLTTNKNVSDMGMVELALNCCYIAKDGSGRYRDYEIDIDERDFVRKLTTTFVGEYLPLQDESFDEEMMDNLGIDPFADVRGLIAIFYRNMWAMAELREKLKRYEDAEEQGLLLRFPCKVGDKIFLDFAGFGKDIDEFTVKDFHLDCFEDGEIILYCDYESNDKTLSGQIDVMEFGKTVFLTKKEAKAKLKEMEGEE